MFNEDTKELSWKYGAVESWLKFVKIDNAAACGVAYRLGPDKPLCRYFESVAYDAVA